MSGQMRVRSNRFTKEVQQQFRVLKGFRAPQRDTSVRAKKRAKLNNYNQHQKDGQ